MHITTFYAGLLALLYLVLAGNVIRTRGALKVNLGDGGHELLQRRIRAHGNFAEYAPLGLVLLGLLEAGGLPPWGLHALGISLLAGRLAHAFALSSLTKRPATRVGGMLLTLTMIGIAALACLFLAARALA